MSELSTEVSGVPLFATLGEAWISLIEEILECGDWTKDGDERLLERLNVVVAVQQVEQDPLLTRFADAERIDLMRRKYASLDPVPPYDKSYGKLFYDQEGVHQVNWVVERLRENPTTKSATIGFHTPGEKGLSCISLIDFKIREEKLCMTAVYRSQNIFSSNPGNMLALADLERKVAESLGVEIGSTVLHAISAHIYERDIPAARAILQSASARSMPLGPRLSRNANAIRVTPRSTATLASEWDNIAETRHRSIRMGRDLSYLFVICPTLLDLAKSYESTSASLSVLDAGCGTGVFAGMLAQQFKGATVTGIDASRKSVNIARLDKAESLQHLSFQHCTVEQWASLHPSSADLIVANMLLQDVSNLDDVLLALRASAKDGGILVFAIPHPCFWPSYGDYGHEDWFSYWEEVWIEAPYRTAAGEEGLVSTHVHRPLERYVAAMRGAGFDILELREPYPPLEVQKRYPGSWDFPRFLLGACRVR